MTTKLTTNQITHSGSDLFTVIDSKITVQKDHSETYDPPAVAAGTSFTQAFTVTGAALGDFVQVSFAQNLSGLTLTAYVSAADQVTIAIHNPTAGTVNLPSGALKFRLTRSE